MAGTSIGSAALVLSTDDQQLRAGLDRSGKAMGQFRAKAEADAKAIKASASGWDLKPLALLGAGAVGLTAGLSLSGLVKDSVMMAAEFEDARATFKVLLGDVGKANALFKEIQEFGAATPLTTRKLVGNAIALLGSGSEQNQIIPTLRLLGDLAQGDEEKLKSVVDIFGQVHAGGKLNNEEMRRLRENSINLMPELAKVMGVQQAELKNLAEEGKIGIDKFDEAIVAAAGKGGRFFGLMSEKALTFNGLLSTLKDNWEILLGNFGQILIDEFGLKDMLVKLAGLFDKGNDALEDMRPHIKAIADLLLQAGQGLAEGMVTAFVMAKEMGGEIRKIVGDVKFAMDGGNVGSNINKSKFNPFYWFQRIALTEEEIVEQDKDAANWREVREMQKAGIKGGPNEGPKSVPDQVKELMAGLTGAFNNLGKAPAGGGGDPMGAAAREFNKAVASMTDEMIKHVKSLNDEFNPRQMASRKIGEMDKTWDLGGFEKNPELYTLSVGKVLKDFIGKGPDLSKPAGIAAFGSSDAVNAVITARNQAKFNVQDRLLAAINAQKEVQKQQLKEAELLRREFMRLKEAGVF